MLVNINQLAMNKIIGNRLLANQLEMYMIYVMEMR